jgi:hypothetical protein
MATPIINRSYFDASQRGRDAAQMEQANALRQRGLQQEIDQQGYVNNILRSPDATPEQMARAGRPDIGYALVTIRSAPIEQQQAAAKLFAEQMTNAARYSQQAPPGQTKQFIEKNFPMLVQTYGPDWATASDDQVRAELNGMAAKFGVQAGIAPKVQADETFGAPQEMVYQGKPAMVRVGSRGTVQPIEGASPYNKPTAGGAGGANESRNFRNIQGLRKEFDGQQAVKDYKMVVPLYRRAVSAPNTRAGDISIIYALGKLFDPGSVVREGELTLSQNTAPWLQKLASSANSQLSGEGALNPETRKAITEALKGQLTSLQQSYNLERERFAGYADENGWAPGQVVGPDPGGDFMAPAAGSGSAPVRVSSPQEAMKLPSGTVFITPDGRTKVRP